MRILIAEDDPVTRAILHRVLVRLGHECLVTRNGTEAWEVFQGTHVDVIISDCMMPEMDGLELCRRVREHPGDTYPYFVFLTLLEHKYDLLSGMRAGADDYLTKPLKTEELQVRLIAASRVTSLHSQLADKRRQLEQLNQRLFEQSREDPLTCLGNRLRLREDFETLSAQTARYDQDYGVILFDVDHFKRYNDAYGHLAGDKVLRAVADVTLATMRGADTVYRFGGEEFLVILSAQTVWSTYHVAERLRQAVEDLGISHEGKVITVSIGVTGRLAGDVATPDDLLRQADEALYQAKSTGRNRVSMYERGA
jgi:two-component system chemotaxis response regulator CheY